MAEDENKSQDAGAVENADDAVQKKGDKAAGEGAPANNQKITNIFLAVNAVLILAMAVMVFMLMTKNAKEPSLADVKKSAEGSAEHGDKKPEGGDKKTEESGGHFIKEEFTVNLKDSKGSHYAKVDVAIEVEDDFVKEEVRKLSPRIRDFIVVTLSSRTYDQIESVDGRDFLREEIRNKINGYLTRGQIKNVYFTQFIIQ